MSNIVTTNSHENFQPMGRAADQKYCFSCGQALHHSATNCPKCGATQNIGAIEIPTTSPNASTRVSQALPAHHVYCHGCGSPVHETAAACPKCGAPQRLTSAVSHGSERNKTTAALLAFFLGGIGAHKFYLGRGFQGAMYLLFCWTFIPSLIALVEGIIYLTSSDANFLKKYQ